jgi:hypothetical protein
MNISGNYSICPTNFQPKQCWIALWPQKGKQLEWRLNHLSTMDQTTKRNLNQRVTHLLIILNDLKFTNEGIRDGITLNQKKLQIKKNKWEPIHCTKCQHYRHITKECISHKYVCANCTGEHRTTECNNKDHTCCISCKSNNHTSWNCKCPEFERRCNTLNTRDQDNTMPYFLMDEP